MPPRDRLVRYAKPVLFAASLLPLAWLLQKVFGDVDALGANPIEAINRYLGDWALRFLLLTLAITPLRLLSGWHEIVRWRRMLGLFAFFYALLHVTSYTALDQQFLWAEILKDVVKRPFITVGFISFVLLIPLAVTSTNAMVRRLGGRRWRNLHRLVYAIAIGAVLHFFWMVKSDIREPLVYAAVLAVLFGVRLWARYRQARATRPAGAAG